MTPTRRLLTVIALLLGTFLSSLDVTVLGTAMPTIVAELGGLNLYGWVFAAYLLTSTTTVPIYGKLADRWGRKPVYLVGVALFLFGSVACGLAPSMHALILARALQGAGAGAIAPMTVTVFGDLFPVEQRVKLQGAFSVVWGVSSVLGPLVGGAIVERLPWPWVFYLNLPFGLLSALLLAAVLREQVPHVKTKVDYLGAILLSASVVSLLAGLTMVQQGASLLGSGLMLSSALLAALFVRVERAVQDPVVPLQLFRDRVIARSTASGVFIGGVLFPVVAFLPLLMRGGYGTSPTLAGAAVSPISVSWTIATFLAGRSILRFGYRPTILAGSLSIAVGSLGLIAATWESLWGWAVAGAVVVGLGMGLLFSSQNVVVQERVAWNQRGAATAMLMFSRTIGGTVFVSMLGVLLGMLVSSGLQHVPSAPDSDVLVNPDRWQELRPEVLAGARAALRDALRWVFAVVAGAGLLTLLVNLGFPRVEAHREGERR